MIPAGTLDVRTAAALSHWPQLPVLPLAACKDSVEAGAFFPATGEGKEDSPVVRQAKAICHRCSERTACLAWAVEHDEVDGIWGGLTAKQRRRLARRQPVSP